MAPKFTLAVDIDVVVFGSVPELSKKVQNTRTPEQHMADVAAATPSHTAWLVGPEHYREVVNRDDAEGPQYHVLPTGDSLRALNILREAAGLQPLCDEHDDQGGPSVSP
jgi:hypothetical protein